MDIQEVKNAVTEIESLLAKTRYMVKETISLAREHLKEYEIDAYTLTRHKKELKNWDSVRGRWMR